MRTAKRPASTPLLLGLLLAAGADLDAAPSGEEITLVRVKYTVDTPIERRANDWRAKEFAHVLPRLSAMLNRTMSVEISRDPINRELTDPDLYAYPFLFMAGHYGPVFTATETLQLRDYLTKGGFLLATACCGNRSFNAAFERELRKVFPERELETLPQGHPIYHMLYDQSTVTCYDGQDQSHRRTEPEPLKAIQINGRAVVILSPNALTCGWANSPTCIASCRRIASEDAYKTAANVLLYALTH